MPATPAPVAASVDVGTVRHRFNFEWATSEPVDGIDTYWWWARSIRVDPSEVIADDGEGNLWSVPFTTDGADEVTFGAPVRVRETYVPVSAGDGAAATAAVASRRQRVLAATLDRPEKPAPHNVSTARLDGQEATMTLEQLARIGLPADATPEQVDARIAELSALEDPDPVTPPVAVDPPITEPTVPDPVPAPVPVAATTAERAELEALRATVASLSASERDRAAREAAATRERVLAAAVASGRITPHDRRAVWEPFYDAAPAAATAQLEVLPARVPLAELGHAGDDPAADPVAAAMNSLGGTLDFGALLAGPSKER